MKHCTSCGKELADNAQFCVACGAKFSVAAEQTLILPDSNPNTAHRGSDVVDQAAGNTAAPNKPKKKKKGFVIILVLVLAISLVVGAGIFLLPRILGWPPIVEKFSSNTALETSPPAQANDEQVALRLAEAEQLAAAGDYTAAMQIVEDMKTQFPDGADYESIYQKYLDANNKSIRQAAMEEADKYAQNKDYLSALKAINDALATIGEDATLQALSDTYTDAYVAEVLAQVDTHIQSGQFDAAKELLNDAEAVAPDSADIQDKKAKIAQYKTVSLSTLTPINGGFTWNEGSPEDPFQNDYSLAKNYTILHGDYCGSDYTLYAEYRTNREYSQLSFCYAPYSDFGETASSYIQIYVNGVLRYTTPKITRKSGAQTIQLDICDADYIQINIKKGEHGCVLLTDVMLSCVSNHSCSKDASLSLSSLSALNGSFAWENDYPQDNLGSTYNYSKNYSVFHGDYCGGDYTLYAEYYIEQKYSNLSFFLAPYNDFGEDASSVVQVYVDDALVYTATITGKTAKIDSDKIDLSNANYLKIVVEKGDYGCVILSDAMLTPAQAI